MIKALKIKNLIHFDDIEVEFNQGLTIITGESGAGKSVIIQAIQTLTGKSIPISWTTQNKQVGFIEGVFEIQSQNPNLDPYLDDSNLLIVRRHLTEGKSSLAQLNGQTVTLKILKELVSPLISTTAQHQQLALLDSSFIVSLLDQKIDKPFEIEFKTKLEELSALNKQLSALSNGTNLAQHRSFLEFQIGELSALNLIPNEDEILKEKKDRILKLDKAVQSSQKLKSLFSQLQELSESAQKIASLYQIQSPDDANYATINQSSMEIGLHLENGFQALSHIESELSVLEVENIEDIENRLDALFRAKSKFNLPSTEALLARLDELNIELKTMNANSNSAEALEEGIRLTLERLHEIGQDWANRRNQAAQNLISMLTETLLKIGFPYVALDFSITFDSNRLSIDGGSNAEMKLSTSPTRAPEPIAKIASGGELSRIFLAITAVLDPKSTQSLVFDEIDAGIGGETANEVGALINSLSNQRQIICITHLPQIAKFAKTHYVVSKFLSQGAIIGKVALLSDDSKNQELKRMIGGSKVLSQIDPLNF